MIYARLICPYCGSKEMCEHSYVDNSEPGTEENPANIHFSKIPVRKIEKEK